MQSALILLSFKRTSLLITERSHDQLCPCWTWGDRVINFSPVKTGEHATVGLDRGVLYHHLSPRWSSVRSYYYYCCSQRSHSRLSPSCLGSVRACTTVALDDRVVGRPCPGWASGQLEHGKRNEMRDVRGMNGERVKRSKRNEKEDGCEARTMWSQKEQKNEWVEEWGNEGTGEGRTGRKKEKLVVWGYVKIILCASHVICSVHRPCR